MEKRRSIRYMAADVLGIISVIIIFGVPFVFMFINSLKERREANLLKLALPETYEWGNYIEVFETGNKMILTGFKNSTIITIFTVLLLVFTCSMTGYIVQRRKDKMSGTIGTLMLVGLMMPPAIMPTIWVMQFLNIYKSLFGMILVSTALQTPFTVMLYRGYLGSVPRELEEAGYIDGCGKWDIYAKIVFPLLKPVTSTVIILNAVTVFNDFSNPLYFLPGSENVTVQMSLYNFMGQYSSSYNLLFADAILITVPMLILFIFFNKKIVDGMVAGAVKG